MTPRQRSARGLRGTIGYISALLLFALCCGPAEGRTEAADAAPAHTDAVAAYLDQIADRVVQQPGYQELIREKGRRVLLQVIVKTGGQLDYVMVDHSSGSSAFDTLAMALVRQAQPFGELPNVLSNKGWFAFILSMPLP